MSAVVRFLGGFKTRPKSTCGPLKVKNYLIHDYIDRYAVTACHNGPCVRGQRLFIRPIESGDADDVRRFFAVNAKAGEPPALGLIGKLVGDLVAVLSMEITGDAVRIDDVFVARELRRKRIGRFMVDELAKLAKKIDRDRIVVEPPSDSREFFRRIGFEEAELPMMVRRLL